MSGHVTGDARKRLDESAAPADVVAFIKALVGAWDCCGTCAGGVLAKRERDIKAKARADERERIAAAIEATTEPARVDDDYIDRARRIGMQDAANIARSHATNEAES